MRIQGPWTLELALCFGLPLMRFAWRLDWENGVLICS